MLRPALASLVALVVLGCAAQTSPPSELPSTYSSPSYASQGGDGASLAHRERRLGEVVVRAEGASFSIAATASGDDEARASAALGARLAALQGEVTSLAPGATLKPGPLRIYRASNGKWQGDERGRAIVSIEARLWVPLAAQADHWARAQLVGRVAAALSRVRSDAQRDATFRYDGPVPEVADARDYEAKLVEAWVARARALVQPGVGLGAAHPTPVKLTECTELHDIKQRPLSLDEVALWLDVKCRFAAP